MTKREPKDKLQIPTRATRPKDSGMFQNLRRPEQVESLTLEEIVGPTTGTGSTSSTGSTAGTGSQESVAPVRDFMKVANSIHRQAVPAGIFTGKRKQLYDYLYSRTRGAIVPTRTVQLSWREIMKGANIGSDKTLREHLASLRAAGLVTWEWETGARGGSVYTIYLPEETSGTGSTGSTSSTGSTGGNSSQNLPTVPGVESTTGTGSVSTDFQRTSEISNTSFKTNTERIDDDEAFGPLLAAAQEVTGKGAPPSQWRELAEVLAVEFKIAAARTTVSSAPAFLAEHLRRRLWKKDKGQLEELSVSSPQSQVSGSKQQIDASKCPDCHGTGMYYPEGFEKGVARCGHNKLTAQSEREV